MYKSSNARGKCGCACSAAQAVSRENTVAAGTVCQAPCADICTEIGACYETAMAQLIFPIQEYTYGFCPPDALARGTMFPELVR